MNAWFVLMNKGQYDISQYGYSIMKEKSSACHLSIKREYLRTIIIFDCSESLIVWTKNIWYITTMLRFMRLILWLYFLNEIIKVWWANLTTFSHEFSIYTGTSSHLIWISTNAALCCVLLRTCMHTAQWAQYFYPFHYFLRQ